MGGVSAIYLEQGFDQFFKPGPGEHPFQLNPLGRITEEFVRFAEKHSDRGTPYTPIAFLLDPAHGWEMTDYPHWPFGVSQISRSDRALRELFGAAYYPGLVREGEPASGERQAFVPGIFGNIFDVLVASPVQSSTPKVQRRVNAGSADVPSLSLDEPAFGGRRSLAPGVGPGFSTPIRPVSPGRGDRNPPNASAQSAMNAIDSYAAIVVGGEIKWTSEWAGKLAQYIRNGGTVILNSAQVKGLSSDFLGVQLTGATAEAH
ncbi:MAG: hypothetical protein ACMG6H_02050, partial [Acidobacteriota bacterium]